MPFCYLQKMLSMIPIGGWLRLSAGLLLVLGPGMALATFHPKHHELDRTGWVTQGLVYSICAWAILLAWLQPPKIAVNEAGVVGILALGWIVAIWRRVRSAADRHPARGTASSTFARVALWGIVVVAAGVHISLLRDAYVGPGSDSLHHTIIAELFALNGGVPANYQPILPLATFRYHFGFHAFVYAVNAVAGLPYAFVTPILSQILVAGTGLTAAYFLDRLTGNQWAGLAAAAFLTLGLVYPAYLIQWGRYPQELGLMLLPVFLAELIVWERADSPVASTWFLGMLAAGIALSHYRIAILAVIAAGFISLDSLFGRPDRWRKLGQRGLRHALIGVIGLGLVLPWFFTLRVHWGDGFPPQFPALQTSFFSVLRLGGSVTYPTNWPSLGLAALATLASLWRRQRTAILLALWGITSTLIAFSHWGSYLFDPVTDLISMCVPAALIIGIFFSLKFNWRSNVIGLAALGSLVGIIFVGAFATREILDPATFTVQADDLPAMDWIRANTPKSAEFAVNTRPVGFLPGFVYGTDAGYWIPVLANRGATTYPLIYSFENLSSPGYIQNIIDYMNHEADLSTPDGLQSLANLGATYIYSDARQGDIQLAPLEASGAFDLVYNHNGVQIFKILPSALPSPRGD